MLYTAKCGLRLASLSVLAGVLGCLSFAFSNAQLYTVCPSGCPFTKIQAALDAAKDGDTITVGPGVYREQLKITKSVSLVGADPAQVRLMPPASIQGLSLIQVGELIGELTLEHLRLEGFTLYQADQLVTNAVQVYDALVRRFTFRNNRVLTSREVTWRASLWGDEVTIERNVFNQGSVLDVAGQKIRLINNDLFGTLVNPFLGDEGNEALVEGNTFREEGLLVSGNTVVRRNQFRSAGVGIDVGGGMEVEFVQVLENEFIGPGLLTEDFFERSAIRVGNSGDRVLIEGNRIANYDVGILIDGWFQPSPETIIRRNEISQGIVGILVRDQKRYPTRIEIVENKIDRQVLPSPAGEERPNLVGAGVFVRWDVAHIEILLQGNIITLGDMGVGLAPESGKFELRGNTIRDNAGWGVWVAVPPCSVWSDPAKVQVTGSGNDISNNGKKLPAEAKQVGDGEGNVCPKELTSLKK
jgi:hypothetical protein